MTDESKNESKHEEAALHALGALGVADALRFEQAMLDDPELAGLAAEYADLIGAMALSGIGPLQQLPPDLKAIILGRIEDSERTFHSFEQLFAKENEALVVTDGQGLIRWVNPNFTRLCGFTLSELRGRKPGHLLQGPLTDPAAVQRMREAFEHAESHTQEIVNYHKNGTPYRVSISLTPVLDANRNPRAFVAIEREIPRQDPAVH